MKDKYTEVNSFPIHVSIQLKNCDIGGPPTCHRRTVAPPAGSMAAEAWSLHCSLRDDLRGREPTQPFPRLLTSQQPREARSKPLGQPWQAPHGVSITAHFLCPVLCPYPSSTALVQGVSFLENPVCNSDAMEKHPIQNCHRKHKIAKNETFNDCPKEN